MTVFLYKWYTLLYQNNEMKETNPDLIRQNWYQLIWFILEIVDCIEPTLFLIFMFLTFSTGNIY